MSQVFRASPHFEDTLLTIMCRFCARQATGAVSPVAKEGKLILLADVTSVSVKAYDATGTLITSTTPTKTDVLYDTLQTSDVWTVVTRGGNFLYDCPATMFPTGNEMVRLEVTVTLTSGEPVRALWDVPVIGLNQS